MIPTNLDFFNAKFRSRWKLIIARLNLPQTCFRSHLGCQISFKHCERNSVPRRSYTTKHLQKDTKILGAQGHTLYHWSSSDCPAHKGSSSKAVVLPFNVSSPMQLGAAQSPLLLPGTKEANGQFWSILGCRWISTNRAGLGIWVHGSCYVGDFRTKMLEVSSIFLRARLSIVIPLTSMLTDVFVLFIRLLGHVDDMTC